MKKLSMEEMQRIPASRFKEASRTDVMVVLDNVRSLMNVGSVFRTMDAFGFGKIWLCGITGTPPHREIHKTALGATESVPWEYHPDTAALLRELSSRGAFVAAVEQVHGSILLHQWQVVTAQPLVLVFGNEINGVSDNALAECHAAIEIPQFGSKHSFNIAVTAGIVLWEVSRQQRGEQ
ncbi:MAG TPA: RNA methyltransferase [Bacteroidales bacterium]|nr:RNA methyltransferase [Bacteroidales bacterium]HRZ48918.1 RNA methyltransferase [Bacteroidales bacterium]